MMPGIASRQGAANMKINIHFIGIKLPGIVSDTLIDVPDKCTISELFNFLNIPKNRQPAMLVFVNDEPTWNATRLQENDYVKLFPRMGGG
jgi:molybdopterin converting factor small subunit